MYVTYDIQELPFPASCTCLFLDGSDILLCIGVLPKNNYTLKFYEPEVSERFDREMDGVNYIPTNENMHVRIATTS